MVYRPENRSRIRISTCHSGLVEAFESGFIERLELSLKRHFDDILTSFPLLTLNLGCVSTIYYADKDTVRFDKYLARCHIASARCHSPETLCAYAYALFIQSRGARRCNTRAQSLCLPITMHSSDLAYVLFVYNIVCQITSE